MSGSYSEKEPMRVEEFDAFNVGDEVYVKHDKKLGKSVVSSIDILDEPIRVLGNHVVGYVRISNESGSDMGYWPSNLIHAADVVLEEGSTDA